MQTKLLLLIFLGVLAASNSANADSLTPALDTNDIHAIYTDGDFDKATQVLEKALTDKQVFTHADSTFVFKHLGVMYAANESTREKGKYYMMQLLTIEPTARIMDMYASDMIYMIFKNIKDEYDLSRERLQRAEQHVAGNRANPSPAPADSSRVASVIPMDKKQEAKPVEVKTKRNARKYYWLGGTGLALAGLGVTAFYFMEEKEVTSKVTYNVQ